MSDLLLGIDLGSTSLKAVVYDGEGNVASRASRPTLKFHPSDEHPQWTVWRPEQIWEDSARAVREAVSDLADPKKIRAVAVTGMGMDGLPVDDQGQWLYPMISWHDPRTQPQLKWWQEHIGAAKVFSIGGNPLWLINSALRILWMADNEREILQKTHKWLLIEDFLNYMLCGAQVTDYSMASCTLLFDQRRLSWSEEMLEASGIDGRLLCEVKPSGTPIGEVHQRAAEATGIAAGTPVILGGHDHLCGALPVGVFRPGRVLDVTGTWETVMTVADEPPLDESLRLAGMTVQAHVAAGKYAVWGGNVAGDMLEWARREIGSPSPEGTEGEQAWQALIDLADRSPPGSRGAMFLPHMSGSSSPVVDPDSLGAWVGLSPSVGRGDLLRAVIEGLDYQFRDMLLALERSLGGPFQRFVAVGGATRNPLWMQNKADVIGRPVEAPAVEEATPLGAAMLAGIGVGIYEDLEDAYQRVSRPGPVYEPHAERAAEYEKRFELYRELYAALRGIHHRLKQQAAESPDPA